MTIYDFIYLACDSFLVAIYDMNSGKEVFRGYSNEIPSELEDMELMSFDMPSYHDKAMVLNVETEEDE